MPGEGRTRRLDREARNVAKAAWHRAFRAPERVGVQVTPVHFSSGLPRVGELAKRPEWWKAKSGLPGLSIDLEAQLDALGSACVPFQGEYRGLDLCEVNYLVLEVLPRLAEGVIVSFHDICLPYDDARNFLRSLVFPLETTLVRAFLINNAAFEVIASLSLLHYERREALAAIFPDCSPSR